MGWYGVDGYHAEDDFDESEAKADAAEEEWREKVEVYLRPLVDAEYKRRYPPADALRLLDGSPLMDHALIEELEEEFRETAEKAAEKAAREAAEEGERYEPT